MKCKDLGKILTKLDNTREQHRGKRLHQIYSYTYENYSIKAIQEDLKNEELDTLNYYEIAKNTWLSKQYTLGTYTHKLNHILWIFLLSAKKSKADLKILDEIINIFDSTVNTFTAIENVESVLSYLKEKGFNTYLEFAKYFNDEYSIDIDEYRKAKGYGFNVKLKGSEEDNYLYANEPIYSLAQSQEIIIDAIRKCRSTVFDSSGNIDALLLGEEIKNKIVYPIYVQNYGYPLLNILKSNRVLFEFCSLDSTGEIEEQLSKILELEEPYKDSLFSSEKGKLLKELLPGNNQKDFDSISMLQKALVIFQYKRHCTHWENSRQVYNFHVFLSQTHREKDDYYIIAESEDFITKNTMNDYVTKQIRLITSLLNI